jgi:hypothetical protein
MGLDAFVSCRCWRDGLAAPPPVAPELIGVDDDGFLGLLVDDDDLWHVVDAWVASACPHRDMRLISRHVANWPGLRLFQAALRSAGEERFPTLLAELPAGNGGTMPPDAAARALDDLTRFSSLADVGTETVLVDADTGDVINTGVPAYDGVFMLGPGYRAAILPDGFVIRDDDREASRTLFHARRFRQAPGPDRTVEFVAEEPAGAAAVTVAMPPVGGSDERPPPHRLRVEVRRQRPDRHAPVVDALADLCRAAVATGNPVVWT